MRQDPIKHLLDDVYEMDVPAAQYEAEYKRLQSTYGYDKPIFYFGIQSEASYPGYYKLTPIQKGFVDKMLRQSCNPTVLQSFIQKTEEALTAEQRFEIYAVDDLGGLKALMKSKYGHLALSDDMIRSKTGRGVFSAWIPVCKWYGTDNQYHRWICRMLKGDFGVSIVDDRPVSYKIYEALRWTLILNICAVIMIFGIGILLGVIAAKSASPRMAVGIHWLGYLFYAIPVFWLATVLVIFLTTDHYGSWTNWFPSVGVMKDCRSISFVTCFITNIHYMILPVICLTLPSLAYVMRQVYVGIAIEKKKRYVMFAKSLGYSKSTIFFTKVLPNALVPLITLVGQAIPALISGSVIIEVIFNIPGVGRLLLTSLFAQDWSVVLVLVILVAIITMLSYMVVDILYKRINPKVVL